MDLLYQRYASPFDFLNRVIRYKRLTEIVEFIVFDKNESESEQKTWEFYLHRVYDRSYSEFKEQLDDEPENHRMTDDEFKTTFNNSVSILRDFNPDIKERNDGII